MPTALIIAAVLLGACVIFVLLLIRHAPEGREDRAGFHGAMTREPAEPQTKSGPPAESPSQVSSRPSAPLVGKK